jgi:hypothetical protein
MDVAQPHCTSVAEKARAVAEELQDSLYVDALVTDNIMETEIGVEDTMGDIN